MSEKNNDTDRHEWYTHAHGKPFRVQRFLDFSGSPCVRMKDGSFVLYSVAEMEQNISAGHWLPVSRPANAIAPAYGLREACEPVDAIDTTISYGDVFAWGSSETAKRIYRLTVTKVKDNTVFYEDGTLVPVSSTPLDHAMDLIASGYWRRVTKHEDTHESSDELTTLRRQYAESLTIIEALLRKYEPETLAKIRGGGTSEDVPATHSEFVRVPLMWRNPNETDSRHSKDCDREAIRAGDNGCISSCHRRIAWEAAGRLNRAST